MKNVTIQIKLADFKVPTVAYECRDIKAPASPAPAQAPAPCAAPQAAYGCNDHDYDSSITAECDVSLRQVRLSEIPAEALDAMCQKFKEDVFRMAGKSDYLLSNTGASQD